MYSAIFSGFYLKMDASKIRAGTRIMCYALLLYHRNMYQHVQHAK